MSELLVDELRQPWESDEHWNLRKEFIEHYQEDFDEDRLLCLAQVYTNVELLSCSYPLVVMQHIRDLAKSLEGSSNLQQARKERAQVQFVKAKGNNSGTKRKCNQENNEESAKKIKTVSATPPTSLQILVKIANNAEHNPFWKTSPTNAISIAAQKLHVKIVFEVKRGEMSRISSPLHHCKLTIGDVFIVDATFQNTKGARALAATKAVELLTKQSCEVVEDNNGNWILRPISNVVTNKTDDSVNKSTNDKTNNVLLSTEDDALSTLGLNATLDLSTCVIYDTSPTDETATDATIFMSTITFNKWKHNFEFSAIDVGVNPDLQIKCDIYVESTKFSTGTGCTKADAKLAAIRTALENLRRKAYTIKLKKYATDSSARVSRNEAEKKKNSVSYGKALPETNIGMKMLKLMGWSGGSIGKAGTTGIIEPITAEGGQIRTNKGFGYVKKSNPWDFKSGITKLIKEFKRTETLEDLVFSNELTNEERKDIHFIARRYNLKHTSRGKDENRYLVLSKQFAPLQLVHLLKEAGGSSEKYELISPSCGET